MSAALAAAAAMIELVFDVTADDRRLGRHRYEITRTAEHVHLAAEVDFRVTILRVPVFRYRHHVKELWRDGCLVTLESTTTSQGNEWSVQGRLEGGVFNVLRTHDGVRELEALDACTASYAYWDPRILIGRTKLLNGQTGTYDPVMVTASDGSGDLRLVASTFTIDLDYRNDRWVRLESTTAEGRNVVYEAVSD